MFLELRIKWQRVDLAKPRRSTLYLGHYGRWRIMTEMTGISISMVRKIYRCFVNEKITHKLTYLLSLFIPYITFAYLLSVTHPIFTRSLMLFLMSSRFK